MTTVHSLVHIEKPLPSGGMVLVLNPGAVIGAEAEAMVQALYSRSVGSIKEHLKVLVERGPEMFMRTYYVGYGHKSIGDCGSCTIFIEGVSMLAAKAVQDTRLYCGQESSTRYIDFAQQPFVDPIGTFESREILKLMREIYLTGVAEMSAGLKEMYPHQGEEKEAVYEKAIAARAFDIMRAYLPAGAQTNLAWHTNLRQASDHLLKLRNHELEEVRTLALTVEEALLEAFPSSFSRKRYENTERYVREYMTRGYHLHTRSPLETTFVHVRTMGIDRVLLSEWRAILGNRPEKTEIPKDIAECGTVQCSFALDFGSFRDLQRHRAIAQRMPFLSTKLGMHPWYTEWITQLESPELSERRVRLESQLATYEEHVADTSLFQYLIPMGYMVPCRITGDLSAMVYMVELRSQQTVHPTLRKTAIDIGYYLQGSFGRYGLYLYMDESPTRFDVRRGEQDIIKRDE